MSFPSVKRKDLFGSAVVCNGNPDIKILSPGTTSSAPALSLPILYFGSPISNVSEARSVDPMSKS